MSYKRLIIMTKSSKYEGSCVAGIDLETGKWVRLVTDNEETHGAVEWKDMYYGDGSRVDILDVADVPVKEACPTESQPENIYLDTSTRMKYVRPAGMREVFCLHPCEKHTFLYGNTAPYATPRNRTYGKWGYSLALVHVTDVKIVKKENSAGAQKTKMNFEYNGNHYEDISVTDPELYDIEEGTVFPEAVLVVSIGAPYLERHYKYVAAMFVNDWQKFTNDGTYGKDKTIGVDGQVNKA